MFNQLQLFQLCEYLHYLFEILKTRGGTNFQVYFIIDYCCRMFVTDHDIVNISNIHRILF